MIACVPDLAITLPETNAQSFYEWHQRFVIEGHTGPEDEKSGTLDFLLSIEPSYYGSSRITSSKAMDDAEAAGR
jgi:hypothetical protein